MSPFNLLHLDDTLNKDKNKPNSVRFDYFLSTKRFSTTIEEL